MCFTPNINTQETVNTLTCANSLTHFCAQQGFWTDVHLKSTQGFFLNKLKKKKNSPLSC